MVKLTANCLKLYNMVVANYFDGVSKATCTHYKVVNFRLYVQYIIKTQF